MNLPARTYKKVQTIASFLAAVASCTHAAAAGQFTVKPIHVFMNKATPSLVMTVENDDAAPLRLQITGFQWSQQANGEMQLTPTDHLVFFPTLVTIAPKESQIIRVAIDSEPTATEQSYRLFFEELPSLESQITHEKGEHLSFRTKIGIPVFFAPNDVSQKESLTATARGNRIDVRVKNDGSVHSMLYNVAVTAFSASGRAVFSRKFDGWYILAQGERDYHITVPKGACSKASSARVTATFQQEPTLTRELSIPRCG